MTPITNYIYLHKTYFFRIGVLSLIIYIEFSAMPLFFNVPDFYEFMGEPLIYDKFIAGYAIDEFNGQISGYADIHFLGARTLYYFFYGLCIVPGVFHFFIYF